MPKNRPDYSSFIHWLNLTQNESDPIAMLARSGGGVAQLWYAER